jgi:class 3 adenylate cyclase
MSLSDIVGFTNWSSNRQPSDVFMLLETIYSSYDKIAVRRKVFKIETIGDCYVAVTGVPEPQADHALIMTRFAHEMLQTLQTLLQTVIAPKLGVESLELAMRVGLNSGPVIAGVLRGDRARFQLFGDTMNTGTTIEFLFVCLLIFHVSLGVDALVFSCCKNKCIIFT